MKRQKYLCAKWNSLADSLPSTLFMGKNRILLVDDNDDVRAMFQEGLEYHGLEVIPAASVNEALQLISTDNFDVLLSDLHMPDAAGVNPLDGTIHFGHSWVTKNPRRPNMHAT